MAEKKTNGSMVVTTHLLACADEANATPVCPRRTAVGPPQESLTRGVVRRTDAGPLSAVQWVFIGGP